MFGFILFAAILILIEINKIIKRNEKKASGYREKYKEVSKDMKQSYLDEAIKLEDSSDTYRKISFVIIIIVLIIGYNFFS